MIPGLDLLAGAHKNFDLEMALTLMPEGSCAGYFDTQFGEIIPRLDKIFQRKPALAKKFAAKRFQLWWDDNHKIAPLDVIEKRSRVFERFAQRYKFKVFLSHSCEHNEKNARLVQANIDAIRVLAPSCTPINCPWTGAGAKNCLEESHSLFKKVPITSTDGAALYDANAQLWNKTHKDSKLKLAWGWNLNGLPVMKPGEPRIPYDERTNWPNDKYILSLIRLLSPKGKPPKAARKIGLYKTHSEDKKGSTDKRANTPMVTLPPGNGSSVLVVDINGRGITEMDLFPGQLDGFDRFYSSTPNHEGLWGFEIENIALKNTGSSFVYFETSKGVKFGPVNPSFRAGSFRG